MFNLIKKIKNKFQQISEIHAHFSNDMKSPKLQFGILMSKTNSQIQSIESLADVEFQVFSQWGDDGIIQYILNKTDVQNKTFVEFGVEDYKESNSRFLLLKDKWHGLVIDGSNKNISYIKKDPIYWATHLFAVEAFITKDNINDLIQKEFIEKGYSKEIGILSIDIDGNDYWVWDKISVVEPTIVIAEYNALFGSTNKWTVPYSRDFTRNDAHKSRTYWGASLNAFCHLAEKKGYDFIGCNSNGNNAYFIKKEKNTFFRSLNSEQGFINSFFREYEENGYRYSNEERKKVIMGLDIFDIDKQAVVKI